MCQSRRQAVNCSAGPSTRRRRRPRPVRAFLDQLAQRIENPVLRQAVREPVAFWGGVFAGGLSLTLSEEPLRSWIERTSAEAGISYQVALETLQQQRTSSS
ncbi:hypothetical protein WJX73_010131 [Symbiochloris irregularis]|uniref:Uncharacterized protein n=1 Tax=Symbiochloris irregularis TaxID=706552 RepID=A0AAW1PJT4_9CHLO